LAEDAAPTFDLQSHSLHSDGALPPREVIAAGAAAGVQLIALSDHDTVDGIAEAAQTADQLGVELVPAVEISAVGFGDADLHVLGYGIDERDPELLARLEDYRADRERRSERMADALRELGFELDDAPLRARAAEGKPIGRPHLAGAVVSHPANAQRLAEEGLTELSPFLVAYLIEGKPAFRMRTHPTVEESIETIHRAGGVAIWAHPFWDIAEPPGVIEAIERFRGFGLDGVECFYPTFTAEQTRLLAEHCAQAGLLATGSSDFHGPEHKLFSRWRAFSTYGAEPRLGPIGT
jgi:predicted metal-dependent phosphoesterase TrpH